jgi:tRNA1Val (adenine37-N6)-methyltransferase
MEIELTVVDGLEIYQAKSGYHFSLEPFFLSNIELNNKLNILDFGSGCGIISILLAKKNSNVQIYAVEQNPDMRKIIKKNINYHNISNVEIFSSLSEIGTNTIDIVLSNPPYFTYGSYRKSQKFNLEKFETVSLEKILDGMKRVIKNKGNFRITYHPTRFSEIINKLELFNFGIKSITPAYGSKQKNASFIIVDSKYNTKSHVVFKKAIFLDEI